MLRLKLNHVNIRGPRWYRVSGVSEKLFYGICRMNINGRYSLIWFTSSLRRFHIQTTKILCITYIHDGVTCVQSVKLAVSDISGFSKVSINCLESWFIYERFHNTYGVVILAVYEPDMWQAKSSLLIQKQQTPWWTLVHVIVWCLSP